MPIEPEGFAFGDIVLVPFPFTSQAAVKRRPAVVVSSQDYNLARPDLVVMAVTSQFRPTATPAEVWLSGWQAAGLLKPSAVKPVIATLEQRLVIRKLGALERADAEAVRHVIGRIIG